MFVGHYGVSFAAKKGDASVPLAQRDRIFHVRPSGNLTIRDVTREAFPDSANSEVAVAGRAGLISAVRRGEAPILARFEGNYASTTMTVMGDRTGFVWQDQPAHNKIDELVAGKWKRMKILPSGLCCDFLPLGIIQLAVEPGQPVGERRGNVGIGNTRRNAFTGPSAVNTDFGIFKNFPFMENKRVQFRAEFFNLVNHPNFQLPERTVTSPAFGTVLRARDARQIQFGLKYSF